jgi:WD40 repeat protein
MEGEVHSFALSQDGDLIAVGDDNGELKLFTYEECRLIHIESVHSGAITAVKISPNNTHILTADTQGHVFFWQI